MTDENGSPPPERESIWSISPGWRTAYFILFVLQNIRAIPESLVIGKGRSFDSAPLRP